MAEAQVVVVGAGPVGLTLANILGLHGVRTALVERNASTVGEPRAVSIDDEALRAMQYIGLDERVRSRIVPGYGSYYFSARGGCFAKVVPETVEYGFPRRSAFRQPVLEAQLREGLQRFDCVEARFSTAVEGVEDAGTHVEVRLGSRLRGNDGGGRGNDEAIRAQYVVACDGASSPIREALGIGMSGSTYDCQWLIVDLAGSTDRFRHTRVFCDPARPGLALPGPEGTRRYEFMLLAGEDPDTMLDEGNVRSLLARHSDEDAGLEIVRKAVYHFHARLAQRWRAGRIFLAGDAAHLSPPFAGQGMNSGLRDAQNLGWKLAWVLRGGLGPGLLDTYEAERQPHAAALIRMAVRMGHVMMPRNRLRALATQAAFRGLALYKPARDYVMQMKYKPPPRYTEGFLAGDAGAMLRGRMFIQPRVERRDGSDVLLDTLLGNGFAAVEWHDGIAPNAPVHAARPLDARIVQVIPRDHRFVGTPANADEQVRDVTGSIATAFERAAMRGVILRPDRYVAACMARSSGAGECDRLLEALRRAAG
jgi:3-(3-hydroxy-phenyl)propionate hydroxylase